MLTDPILVVDAAAAICTFMEFALQGEGYEVFTASNGLDALRCIAQSNVSLIVLDIQMPVMNGIDFLMAYHKLPPPHVPIIAISANSEAIKASLPHIVKFLYKPFELEEFLAYIEEYM